MYRNLVRDLILHERIETTEAKAKEIRPMAERIITRGRAGSLHDRREVLRFITDQDVVKRLFDEVGPRFQGRPGGYTRITKTGQRKGDGAPMAVLELVEGPRPQAPAAPAERAASRRLPGIGRRRETTEQAPATEAIEE
jgi:large subunit ribosomal protein L17